MIAFGAERGGNAADSSRGLRIAVAILVSMILNVRRFGRSVLSKETRSGILQHRLSCAQIACQFMLNHNAWLLLYKPRCIHQQIDDYNKNLKIILT